MSPYLVHMTGVGAIAKILAGDGATPALPPSAGFLKAVVPEYDGFSNMFSRAVVCFSESPLFALDFFRYRSFRRWQDDQRFGIGFNKAKLAARGVRPVVYLDAEVRSYLRALQVAGELHDWRLTTSQSTDSKLKGLVEGLAPLVFPLLEEHQYQGFMWEREWRAADPDGFPFAHDDIEIICCPAEEEASIRKALGGAAGSIQFVRTWIEYDDVTSFLRQREELRAGPNVALPKGTPLPEQIKALDQQRTLHEVAIHSLESFVALSEQIATKGDLARRELDALRERREAIDKELSRVRLEKEQADAVARKTPNTRL